jgi:diguanylate cyclase (GGDEF)-like protein
MNSADISQEISMLQLQFFADNWSSNCPRDSVETNVRRPTMRILVVEDDQATAAALTTLLTNCSYAVETAADGESAADMVEAFDYDLLLLDVKLPKLDGITLCRQVRNQGYAMPILLLTGNDNSHEKAVGLDAGADDYVVKPFDLEELEARIRALLRRGQLHTTPILEWAGIQLDPSSTQVNYGDQSLSLTPKEYALLELLMRNPRRVFSCGMLLEHLWTYEDMPGEEAVRTHIKGLRHKLRDATAPPDVIETVYGIGYRLKPLSELKTNAQVLTLKDAQSPLEHHAGVAILENQSKTIATIWRRYQSRISNQVQVIEQASAALAANPGFLDRDLQQQAEQEAHTLAGSLGMFGMQEGTALARHIEEILKIPKPLATEDIQKLQEAVDHLRQTVDHCTHSSLGNCVSASTAVPSLLVIDADQDWSIDLTEQAAHWDWHLQTVTDLETAYGVLAQTPPQVILIDPDIAQDKNQTMAFLDQVNVQAPNLPVLFMGHPDGLHSRLEVVRLGGKVYLEKPIAPIQVLHAVDRVLQQAQAITAKVMIVDDDHQILQILPPLLEPWGFKVNTLADPRLFWQTLVTIAPDLLILDVEMPYVSGMELCQVVRNDPYWHNLPILFLTAHTEAEIVNQIFAAGADDFVSKPVVGPELVVRLVNRLERMQLSQQLWQVDTLTKADKRQSAMFRLEQMIKRAETLQQPLCIALIKILNLRQINHDHDLATGDAVLRHVGQHLCQGCGEDDVVARWSGSEFLIGLYGVYQAEAEQHLQHLWEVCRQENPDQPVLIQVKMGIAQYPEVGVTLFDLYKAADQHVVTLTPISMGEGESCVGLANDG